MAIGQGSLRNQWLFNKEEISKGYELQNQPFISMIDSVIS
jgi:hypothetical protein